MQARIQVDFSAVGEPISRNIYGHFAEHLGSCIYGGMWVGEEGELAQAGLKTLRGWRLEVIELVRALSPPLIRWPGGCFSEYYHWEDGIGPRQERPMRMDWFWKKPEPNWVGTHEFIDFCRLVGAEPLLVANVRTGSPEEAAAWVEYCNCPMERPQGRRRAQNGHPEPFGMKYWGIGNETWEVPAEESAKRQIEFAKAMKEVDPSIRVVAVGGYPPNLAEWNRVMLRVAGEHLDYIAPHHYDGVAIRPGEEETLHYANQLSAERIVETARRTAEQLDELLPQRPETGIGFDEWGIWTEHNQGIQQNFNLSDGLVVAGVLNGFQRIGRRMQIACWAQLVNCLGMIQADARAACATPVYEVFRLYSNLCGSNLAENAVEPPNVEVREKSGTVSLPLLDASATTSPDSDQAALVMINRSYKQEMEVTLELTGLRQKDRPISLYLLEGPSVSALNEPGKPPGVWVREENLSALPEALTLPAHSLSLLAVGRRLSPVSPALI